MTFIIHPLTQQNGQPEYTAADFRLTVSNFLTAGTSEFFGAVQGVRADNLSSLASMSGSTITVRPHSGIIAPWDGVGAYAYAITSNITVTRPTTGDYYVVLTVEDPSQSHGSEPQGRVDLIPTSTPRASITGLVIAKTDGSSFYEIANRLRNGTVIETVGKNELDLIKPAPRTKAVVRFGEGVGEYEFNGSKWVLVNPKPETNLSNIVTLSSGITMYNDIDVCSAEIINNRVFLGLGFSGTIGGANYTKVATLKPQYRPTNQVYCTAAEQFGTVGGCYIMTNGDIMVGSQSPDSSRWAAFSVSYPIL